MKILVNYDLINSIKNVNEPMSPFKIVRNKKASWAKFNLPIYTAIDLTFNKLETIPLVLAFQFGLLLTAEMVANSVMGFDIYKNESDRNLKRLVPQLQDLNVETDYDMLLKSELDDKSYRFRLNDKKIPELIETKYILVPSYNYQGDIKSTSIQQDHVVGSKTYVLSIGSKQRQMQLAYANI